jgi:acyl-CoA thioesterase I
MPGESDAVLSVYTFGDSILDSGSYNAHGLHAAQLLVANDDRLFPEFQGRDLRSRQATTLDHRAVDGATVDYLGRQLVGMTVRAPAIALLTIGGNDLITGLAADTGDGMRRFARTLDGFLQALPVRPVLLGNVYDPTFGDDTLNFLGVEARLARANLQRVNQVIGEAAARYGALADLHQHFLTGDPSWYVNVIEPSLLGASEVRRVFLATYDASVTTGAGR